MKENKINKQKYTELVKRVNISQINLVKINSEKYYHNNKNKKADVVIGNKPSVREILKDRFVVEFETNISSSSDEDEKIFNIDIKYELLYFVEGGIDKEEYGDVIDYFAYRNVPVNIWPYIRELVSEITVRMGFAPLVLKPLKVF